MANYSKEEYVEMTMAYGLARGLAREAQRVYQERHPNRKLPYHHTFSTTYRRMPETVSVNFREPRINLRQNNVAIDDQILQGL